MNIISLLKNKFDRIIAQKVVIIMAFIVVPIMIGLAVLFTDKADLKGNIALVSENAVNIPKDNRIKIDVLNKKPAFSQLLIGKYVAIVEEKNSESFKVTTLKNETDKKVIEDFLKTGKMIENTKDKKGAGTNILGFILMILLMQGVALITLYTEDRKLRTCRRILTAPVSEKEYIFAQGIFTFLCLYIPSYIALVVTKLILKVDIGFNFVILSILVGILSALSTALALFIATILERNYSLASSGIYVITCVLSGCYISFTENNRILNFICNIFPQKEYMTLIQGVEKGNGMMKYKGQLIYLLIWIIGLWLLGSVITRKKMKEGVY